MNSSPVAARFNRYRLPFFQAGWILLTALSVVLYAVSIPLRIDELASVCAAEWCGPIALDPAGIRTLEALGLSNHFYAWYLVGVETFGVIGFMLNGLFIFWRRSNHSRSLFHSITLITYAVFIFPGPDALLQGPPFWRIVSHAIQAVGFWSSLVWLYVFPTGTFRPGWTKPLTYAWAGLNLAWVFFPQLPFNPTDPYRMPVQWFLMFNLWYVSGLVAQVARYRRISSPPERQQTKWVIFGLTVAIVGFIAFLYPLILSESLSALGLSRVAYILFGYPFLTAMLLCIPVTEMISILRWRLHDIDVLIRRTLLYSALTGCLAIVYGGSVLMLQRLLPAESLLATVLSTLAVAALFSPQRGWLQDWIDRRFYRQKYNTEQALAQISVLLRENVELEKLTAAVLSVVEQTMHPAHAVIWILPAPGQAVKPPEEMPAGGSPPHSGLVAMAGGGS